MTATLRRSVAIECPQHEIASLVIQSSANDQAYTMLDVARAWLANGGRRLEAVVREANAELEPEERAAIRVAMMSLANLLEATDEEGGSARDEGTGPATGGSDAHAQHARADADRAAP